MLSANEPAKLLITIFITIGHENGFKATKKERKKKERKTKSKLDAGK